MINYLCFDIDYQASVHPAPRCFRPHSGSYDSTIIVQNITGLETIVSRSRLPRTNAKERIGTPQEIARAAAHLLSDAGAWITGQVLPVDGGMSTLRTFR
jgi:NAD(P)-dependent dehydrogenase (short-subunit alcohol dehydrogenase family)